MRIEIKLQTENQWVLGREDKISTAPEHLINTQKVYRWETILAFSCWLGPTPRVLHRWVGIYHPAIL